MQLCSAIIGWLTWGQFSTSLSHTRPINQETGCANWTAANSSTQTNIKRGRGGVGSAKRETWSSLRPDRALRSLQWCLKERKDVLRSSRIVHFSYLEDQEVWVSLVWVIKCTDLLMLTTQLWKDVWIIGSFLISSHELNSANKLCLIIPGQPHIKVLQRARNPWNICRLSYAAFQIQTCLLFLALTSTADSVKLILLMSQWQKWRDGDVLSPLFLNTLVPKSNGFQILVFYNQTMQSLLIKGEFHSCRLKCNELW